MGRPVITAENLGKRYFLGHQAPHGLLRDRIAELLRNPLRHLRAARRTAEEFWALREVGFTVNQGDVLGIVGRNGAGKSTLLKILSRITEPTTGRIMIEGRIASLLEVGTGFHGELSGRENIFLNGAILGMTRSEVRRKFDEIVAFAEIEKFLDTPVKRYSSGMYVRLAFAVAAHLEPEILVVDEVLAVGDADFRRKCLRKMDEVTRQEGRTILFVSHQQEAVRQLCNRVLLLEQGRVTADTDVENGLRQYSQRGVPPPNEHQALGPELRLSEFSFGATPAQLFSDVPFRLGLTAQAPCTVHELCLLFFNDQGERSAIVDLRDPQRGRSIAQGQTLWLGGTLHRIALLPGAYSVGLFLRTSMHRADHRDLHQLHVQSAPGRPQPLYAGRHLGHVAIDATFNANVGDRQ